MNDPNFRKDTIDIQPNCVVQPILEIVTRVDDKAGDKSLISYSCAKLISC